MDPTAPLAVGQHRFQLIVLDDADPPNQSDPAQIVVLVVDTSKPNAVIEGPSKVTFNQPFQLTGNKSVDVGGKIVLYRWTMLD